MYHCFMSCSNVVICTDVCEAASELILLSLRQRNIDIAGKVYTLVREYELEARLRDDTNRSLLNALCSVKRFIYARDIFEQLKDTILFSEQSFEAPRCIYLHRSNTLAEIVMIIKDYLACLYSKYVELVRENVSLSSQHLKLNIAFNPNSRFTVDRQEVFLPVFSFVLRVSYCDRLCLSSVCLSSTFTLND